MEQIVTVPQDGPVPEDQGYFALLDAVSTPICLHRVGKVIYANVAFQHLSGFSADEFRALPFFEIGYGEWQQILRQRGEARMRGEKVPSVYEFRLNTKGGEERWVELTASRVMLGAQPTVFCSLNDLTDRKRAEATQKNMQQLLQQIIDGDPVPTFVIDTQHRVTHWNRACASLTGIPSSEVIGSTRQWKPFYPEARDTLADLIVKGAGEAEIIAHYPNARVKLSPLAEGAFEGEGLIPTFGDGGSWVFFTAAPLRSARGRLVGAIQKMQDTTERRQAVEALQQYHDRLQQLVEERTVQLAEANARLEQDIARRESAETELRRRYMELTELNIKLSEAQEQLLQSEKLASIGQLAAGVAHEINNPIGYVHSNIGSLEKYLDDLFAMLLAYQAVEPALPAAEQATVSSMRQKIDIDFLREDIPMLMSESKEGVARVKKIIQDLKDFSRVDSTQEWQWSDLHRGIDSTINIATNEIKYKADVIKEYGQLPDVECLPSQLNQVFMNLLVNSAHAMGEKRGHITIRTGVADDNVWLEFSDDGCGIPEENRKKIFDPFFTTKPVGKGTGLGLSLTYGIVQKHGGEITVDSTVGKGTCFRITLPVSQSDRPAPTSGGVQ